MILVLQKDKLDWIPFSEVTAIGLYVLEDFQHILDKKTTGKSLGIWAAFPNDKKFFRAEDLENKKLARVEQIACVAPYGTTSD